MTDTATERSGAPDPGLRPRPSINEDNRYFWDGTGQRELRIQTCSRCQEKYFPPTPRCWACGSYELGWTVASGRAELYSWAVAHHPQAPGFEYPLVIGLVELEEGTRLVSNIVDCPRDRLAIGMALELRWLDCQTPLPDGTTEEWRLPQFAPRAQSSGGAQ